MAFQLYKGKEPTLISDKTTKANEDCFTASGQKMAEWEALTPEEREELYKQSVCRKYHPGETVFCQDDKCRGVYFIKEGLVRVYKITAGGDTVTLRLAKSGDTLGYRPFLSGQPHLAFAEALNESIVCFFSAGQMKKLLLENPRSGFKFLEKAARELGQAEERFAEAVTQDVRPPGLDQECRPSG